MKIDMKKIKDKTPTKTPTKLVNFRIDAELYEALQKKLALEDKTGTDFFTTCAKVYLETK